MRAAPHRRFDPLQGRWLVVSPQRLQRPWQGHEEDATPEELPAHDPACYLCPGNERADGRRNPDYEGVFVFDNDFPALLPDIDDVSLDHRGLLVAETERGICRVLCFSPRHDVRLAEMDRTALRRVVDVWAEQYDELGALDDIAHVQIFENRGAMMGASNPHPHGQLWAQEHVPDEVVREDERQRQHHRRGGTCLLCDYLAVELLEEERLIVANDAFVAVVPFWAVWPFETLVLPRHHVGTVSALDEPERDGLGDILRRLTRGYDALFGVPFPYSMGVHQSPTDGRDHDAWHLHAHFYPPLLRSASVRKFMVGFELLGQPQRDVTAEAAAARLRASTS
ncbi:MAG: UDP-glucose--hexose-1-phosphate uridylyltransferase [Actinobacteria bacterium]|nr:UDP-glucose--hexose-1-phosphate uridylyltransferase [Actinomycetota bacterium]